MFERLQKYLFAIFLLTSGFSSVLYAAPKTPIYPSTDVPARELFVGEKLQYSITYFGVPIGNAESYVKEVVDLRGRKAYHIIVDVASTSVVDLIYKVRGRHHTYIDVKKLYSLRYREMFSKQPDQAALEMNFDHSKNQVDYFYPKRGIHKIVTVPDDVQDRLSMGFFFRTIPFKGNDHTVIPMNTKQKNWSISVRSFETKIMDVPGIGVFEVMRVQPQLDFVKTLHRKGSVNAWISRDERRIPVELTVRAPLIGNLKVTLISYTPGISYKKR